MANNTARMLSRMFVLFPSLADIEKETLSNLINASEGSGDFFRNITWLFDISSAVASSGINAIALYNAEIQSNWQTNESNWISDYASGVSLVPIINWKNSVWLIDALFGINGKCERLNSLFAEDPLETVGDLDGFWTHNEHLGNSASLIFDEGNIGYNFPYISKAKITSAMQTELTGLLASIRSLTVSHELPSLLNSAIQKFTTANLLFFFSRNGASEVPAEQANLKKIEHSLKAQGAFEVLKYLEYDRETLLSTIEDDYSNIIPWGDIFSTVWNSACASEVATCIALISSKQVTFPEGSDDYIALGAIHASFTSWVSVQENLFAQLFVSPTADTMKEIYDRDTNLHILDSIKNNGTFSISYAPTDGSAALYRTISPYELLIAQWTSFLNSKASAVLVAKWPAPLESFSLFHLLANWIGSLALSSSVSNEDFVIAKQDFWTTIASIMLVKPYCDKVVKYVSASSF